MSEQPTIVKFGGQPCVIMDPAKYPQARGKANGYCCPLGKSPGIGYVLMLRREWDRIKDSRNAPQTFEVLAGDRITLPGMYIISAIKISGGRSGDVNAVYLVKFADKRWLAAKLSDVTKQINVRCPAPPYDGTAADLYYEDSLDSGSLYTWATAAEALWEAMPILGTFPGLPYSPDGSPEGFQFLGVNAWDALHVVLDKIECAVSYNPAGNSFSIVKLGTTQAGLVDALAGLSRGYTDDAEPFDTAVSQIPEKIRVYFNRLDEHYGSQWETKRASGTWATALLASVDVATSVDGAQAGTVVQLWDDLPAIADFDGSILNSSALSSRASQRANTWLANQQTSTARLRTVYQGIAPLQTGSQLKYVEWRNWGDGWLTEVGRYNGFLDPEARFGGSADCDWPRENISPPDVARKTFPNFPQYLQLVTVDSSSGGDPAGTTVSPAGSGLFHGLVTRVNPDANTATSGCFETAEACWLLVVNRLTGSSAASPTLVKGERYLARLCGSKIISGDGRPVYEIHKEEVQGELTFFELTDDLEFGVDPVADNAAILEWDGDSYGPTGAAIRVFDWTTIGSVDSAFWVGRGPSTGVKGYRGLATVGPSGRYEVVWMEEQARYIKFQTQGQLKYNASSVGADLLDYFDGRKPPVGTVTVYNVETAESGVYQFWGPDDAVGYAVWNDASEYRIIWIETQAKWIEGTYDATSAGTAAFSAGTSIDATVNNWWDGKEPPDEVDVHDPQGLFVRALQEGKFLATFNEQYDDGNGGYIVVESESKAGWIDFTLDNAMAGGNSTGAIVDRYGGSQQDIQDPGEAVTVYDDQDLWKYAPAGAKGRAIYDASADRYRIVECQNKAKWIKFTIAGSDLETTDASKSACTVNDYWQGVNPGSTVTIYNQEASSDYIFEGAVGHKGLAVWDDIDDKYRIVQMECP